MFKVFFIWAIQRCQLLEIKCAWTAISALLSDPVSWWFLMPSILVLVLSCNCANDKLVIAQWLHALFTKIVPACHSFLLFHSAKDSWKKTQKMGTCELVWWILSDRRRQFSLISRWDHCQRSFSSRISETLGVGFEPVQNLSSGLVEWRCAVVITKTNNN